MGFIEELRRRKELERIETERQATVAAERLRREAELRQVHLRQEAEVRDGIKRERERAVEFLRMSAFPVLISELMNVVGGRAGGEFLNNEHYVGASIWWDGAEQVELGDDSIYLLWDINELRRRQKKDGYTYNNPVDVSQNGHYLRLSEATGLKIQAYPNGTIVVEGDSSSKTILTLGNWQGNHNIQERALEKAYHRQRKVIFGGCISLHPKDTGPVGWMMGSF